MPEHIIRVDERGWCALETMVAVMSEYFVTNVAIGFMNYDACNALYFVTDIVMTC